MSNFRQSDDIASFVRDYASGALVPSHVHDRDQLVYGSNGVMTVHAASGVWVTPPDRAVWIPSGVEHSIRMSGTVAMRSLYFRAGLVRGLPRACSVVGVSNLLKELILHVCERGTLKGSSADDTSLIEFLISQMQALAALPLELPTPTEPRARRLAELLNVQWNQRVPLAHLCRESGGSRRTLERLFRAETGLSLGRWRQRLVLIQALQELGEGSSVTQVAFQAGYSSTSAFCVAFRNALGSSPSTYFNSTQTSVGRAAD
jgi:AraC-like DNA-binding protein